MPNGQLAVYRTGGGYKWVDVDNPTGGAVIGTLTDAASGGTNNVIEAGDTITLNGKTYKISSALDGATITNPTITINGTTYKLAPNTTMLKGVCTSDSPTDCEDVSDIAIYRGTDGFYYVNTSGKMILMPCMLLTITIYMYKKNKKKQI